MKNKILKIFAIMMAMSCLFVANYLNKLDVYAEDEPTETEVTFSIPSSLTINSETGECVFGITLNVGKNTNAAVQINSENASSNGENSEENEKFINYGISYLKDGDKKVPYTLNDIYMRTTAGEEAKSITNYFTIKLDASSIEKEYAATYSDILTFELHSETIDSYTGDILTIYIGEEIEDVYLKYAQDNFGYTGEYLPLEAKITVIRDVLKDTKLLDNADFCQINDQSSQMQEMLGVKFLGWYTKPNGKGEKITEDYVYDGIHNAIYGYWGNKISFVSNSDTSETLDEIEASKNEALDFSNVTTPTRENYKFLGWYTEKEGGTEIKDGDIYDGSYSTLYAHWKKMNITITFDWNDTLGTQTSRVYKTDEECQELETPTRGTSGFLGWYTSKVNGEQITEKTIFTEDTTLYARWNLNKATLITGNLFNQLTKNREIITFNYDKLPDKITNIKKISNFYYTEAEYYRDLIHGETLSGDDLMFSDIQIGLDSDSDSFNEETDALDVSEEQNGSIVMWFESTTNTVYVSTQDVNTAIYANPDCSFMFFDEGIIRKINFINFDTSNVTNMKGMFAFDDSERGRNKLTTIDLSCFDSSKVKDMSFFFYCRGWTVFNTDHTDVDTVDISSFDTSNVEDMSYMFFCTTTFFYDVDERGIWAVYNDSSLLMPEKFDTSNVKNMDYMFAEIGTNVVGNENFSKKMMFSNYDTSKITSAKGMFYENKAATYLDLSNFEINESVNTEKIFYDCSSLKSISFGEGWKKPIELPVHTYEECSQWEASDGSMYKYNTIPTGKTDTYKLIVAPILQKGIDFNKNITSDITAIEFTTDAMPSSVTSYTDVSANQDGTILAYTDGTTLKVSPKFNGQEIYANLDCEKMFVSKAKLTSIEFDNFNTNNVTSMSYMFYDCSSLTSLDVSKFDTSKVTDMSAMFYNCESLTSLNLSNFNTSKVTDMSAMFNVCSKLTTIYVSSSFTTDKVTLSNQMFYRCNNLVGGNGTKYSSSYIDKTYARIDTSSTPGYFTLKSSDEEVDDTDIISVTSLAKTYSNADFALSSDSTIETANLVDEANETAVSYYHLNDDEDLNSLLATNITSISINGVMISEDIEYDDTKFALEQSEDGVLTITSITKEGYPSSDDWKALIYSDIFTDINEDVTITVSIINLKQDTEISGFALVGDTEEEISDSNTSSVPSEDSNIVSWDSTGETVIIEKVEANPEGEAKTTASPEDMIGEEISESDSEELIPENTSEQSETQTQEETVE